MYNIAKFKKRISRLFADCYTISISFDHIENIVDYIEYMHEQHNDKNKFSEYPFDELFIWSLFLFSGFETDLNIMRYYWTMCSNPIASILVVIIISTRLRKEKYVADDLKLKINGLIKYTF